MKIICAWCSLDLGEKEPLEDTSTTHTICPACARIHFNRHRPDDPPTPHVSGSK